MRSLVRTSSTPGCTRAINFFEARARDGMRITLVDLPGYGYAARSRQEKVQWAQLIEHYLLERPSLSAVVVLVDIRRGLEKDDLDLLELLSEQGPRSRAPTPVMVATKLDRVAPSQRARALAGLAQNERKTIGFSTELPETTANVWRALRAAIR
jgi:GTP-binding protein